MKVITKFALLALPLSTLMAATLPSRYIELVKYVQPSPDQGDTNSCWFMASTGAMELLLNKKNSIESPRKNGPYDLSESFLMWQKDYKDRKNPPQYFIEEVVQRFNYLEAVHNKDWPFKAYNSDGTANMSVWDQHPEFTILPRLVVPAVKTELLFAIGNKWSTYVLENAHIEQIKTALVKTESPIIINYNDEGYWHVILIVGYDDSFNGSCYDLEASECNRRGAFIVRDSNGRRTEARAYNWFLYKGNAAATVELK